MIESASSDIHLHVNKVARRVDKKHKRCQHNLERQTGAICSTVPTKNLGVCNAGLSNGLSEEELTQHFSEYGPIKRVVGVLGKSYSFVEYKDASDAILAYQAINGQLNIAQGNKPLYLAYIEKIPFEYSISHETQLPPGLVLLNEFISELEEENLLSMHDFEASALTGALKHRLVKHYGYEFCYDINNVQKDCPLKEKIPDSLDFLWERLKVRDFAPDQLTINYYRPGNGIPAHVDTHSAFEDPLVSLSLGSGVVMEFEREGKRLPVYLPQRSLAVISGEARYAWTHKIVPRKLDVVPSKRGVVVIPRKTRTSFTFRKVLKGACHCKFPDTCDSQSKANPHISKINSHNSEIDSQIKSEINSLNSRFNEKGLVENKLDETVASKLEETHVHEVYESIAGHFSETRHKPWPDVENFVNSFEVGSILVDVGCGNGKYLSSNPNIFKIGCDRSFNLLDVCHSRGFEIFTCNCLQIPLKDQSVDGAICIAVIHHLATPERRLQSIVEITRILRVGGKALIYVWAKDQCKNEKSTYLKQDRKNRKASEVSSDIQEEIVVNGVTLPVHVNRKQFQKQDMLVPWKNKGVDREHVFLRYYHVFEEGELEGLCAQISNVRCVHSYYDQGNWCIVIKKIAQI